LTHAIPIVPTQDDDSRSTAGAGRRFKTSSGRTVPIEYTRLEELDFRLHKPIRLPRLPRPSIRKMLSNIPRLIPARVKGSRGAQLARRHPAFAAWLVVFAGLGVVIATHEPAVPHPRIHQARYQKWLEREGARTIRTALAEIGPSVKIPSVEAQPIEASTLGFYTFNSDGITFNSSLEYDPIGLLDVAAHECVHGIFDQNNLVPNESLDFDYVVLVYEVAAYVLGAHITGAVLSRDGRDGSIATERLFQDYRRACDPADPDSMYNLFLTPNRIASHEFDRDEWLSELVHFGAPLALVDGVYEICYLESDPVDAARKIAQRFLRRDLAPRDRPILEEFERTKARWSSAG
jgi:hypothetical protein